jgi:hypothetical protein
MLPVIGEIVFILFQFTGKQMRTWEKHAQP